MALSPFYGWSEPDNSSLVKNGAADIRTLGDAIDTSLWNSGYGQAGKNKIINGDFGIWQRGTTFTNPATATYLADRFVIGYNGTASTRTFSQQTFTPATAPVAGYEGTYFLRCNTTNAGSGNTTLLIRQPIEDVRTFAGQTVTFSFWMKSGTTGRNCEIDFTQVFGSGGSADVDGTNVAFTSSNSWTRHSFTIAIPSVSGKTIGAGSYINFRLFFTPGIIETFDIWGWQVEYGSKATPFQTASGGSPQAELAICQRYFQILGNLFGYANSTTSIQGSVASMQMRTTPTAALTTATPTGESPINVTAVTGAASTTSGSGNLNQYGSQFIRVTGFTGLTLNALSYVTGGQITLSAEL